MKFKLPKSTMAKDNLGLAYKYAKMFCPSNILIEDSDIFADALIGLVLAERDFDPSRGFTFSTCAYKYMMSACSSGYKARCRQEKLQPYQAEEEWQFGLSEDENLDSYEANAVTEVFKNMSLEKYLQKDLEMLLAYHLEEITLEKVGERYGISKERVRQRVNRVKKHIAETIDLESLKENIANVCGYRNGLQLWWKDDFNTEVLSRSRTAESRLD